MNITKFSIQRPVGISMIFMLITVLGLFSYSHIGVELLPDVESPYISCIVEYPGASTESVEQQRPNLLKTLSPPWKESRRSVPSA